MGSLSALMPESPSRRFYGEEAGEHKNPGTVVGYSYGYLIHARRAFEDGYNIVEE